MASYLPPSVPASIASAESFPYQLISPDQDGPPVPPPDPLSASKPTLTGDPCVGYTLTCSEPVPAGGVPPYTFNYFWVDVTRDERMAPTTVVTTYDLGKQMKCLVTVSDSAGETVQVETDPTIAVFRPSLDDYSVLVDDVPYDGVSVGVLPNGILTIAAVVDDPVLFPPKDVTFAWELRSGLAALAVIPTCLCWLRCTGRSSRWCAGDLRYHSTHAQDVQSAQIEFLVTGPRRKALNAELLNHLGNNSTLSFY